MGGKQHCHTNMLCLFRAKDPSVSERYDTLSNKKHVPGSKDSTKSLPKLHSLTIHSFSLPLFACFSELHRLIPAASTHQTVIHQLSASSRADLTGKWSFGLGAAVIRAMEIPLVKINSIAPPFSILGH